MGLILKFIKNNISQIYKYNKSTKFKRQKNKMFKKLFGGGKKKQPKAPVIQSEEKTRLNG